MEAGGGKGVLEYWIFGFNAVFHYSITPLLSPSFRPRWRLLARAGIQEIHGKLDYPPSTPLRTCFRGNDDGEALTYSMSFLDGTPAGCSKRSQRRGARKIDERRRTLPVRWSEAIERNEAYESFSAAC
jgi:hypothetical protein